LLKQEVRIGILYLLIEYININFCRQYHGPCLNVYETKAEENERMLRPLPTERSAWIIVWRNGVKCGRSRKAVKMATAGGYKNICQHKLSAGRKGSGQAVEASIEHLNLVTVKRRLFLQKRHLFLLS
jgi:hypothetical protein